MVTLPVVLMIFPCDHSPMSTCRRSRVLPADVAVKGVR